MAIAANLLRGAALSAISLVCAAAYADPSPLGAHSLVVHYQGFNLERPRDVTRLYNRITVAADRVCGPRTLTGSYYKTADYQACFADAVAQAVDNVDQPSLTAYYRQRSPEPRRAIAQR
jgi:UrcA family protein